MKYIKKFEQIHTTKVIPVGQWRLTKPISKKSPRKKLPKAGDYVVLDNRFLDRLKSDVAEFFRFASENVGLVIDFKLPQYQPLKEIWWNSILKYGGFRIIEYDYLPEIVFKTISHIVNLDFNDQEFFAAFARDSDIVSFNNKYYILQSCSSIRFFSKSREDCEIFINAEKYNL